MESDTRPNSHIKTSVRINVAIHIDIHYKIQAYANAKGMKINKVVEFAILDYLTKAQTK